MLEEPALLTVRRPSRRPSAQQIAAFQNVPTSIVVDALHGGQVLDRKIRLLSGDPHVSIAGPALTADSGAADVLALFAALDFVQTGDVVVNAAHGHQACASLGDRVAAVAKNAGAVAVISDGPARDFNGIQEVGLPVWCTGLTPNTPYSNGPGKVGTPVNVGGQHIETGDMIVADYDGVVVVPFDQIDAIAAKLQQVIALEKGLEDKLKDGLSEFPGIKELLASDRTRYIE